MAGGAKTHKVFKIMSATLGDRLDVVYFLGGCHLPVLLALLTQWMQSNVTVTDSFPRPAVAFLGGRVTLILLVTSGFLLLMLFTESTMR